MPLPVRSRRYDEEFWKELLGGKGKRSREQNLRELGFGGLPGDPTTDAPPPGK